MRDILQHCPDVENLALWLPQPMTRVDCQTTILPLLEDLAISGKLKRLSFDPSFFFRNSSAHIPIPFNQPAFNSITHLEIINFSFSWSKWSQLSEMPRLTHLGTEYSLLGATLAGTLFEACKGLQLLVLLQLNHDPTQHEYPQNTWEMDSRVVILCSEQLPATAPIESWEIGARGGPTIWSLAEACRGTRSSWS
jgi:hypothetical protein